MPSVFQLDLADPDDARRATRNAAIAAVVSAVLTVAVIALAQGGADGDDWLGVLSWWSLIDVALLLGLAYGTYRGNRYAATGLAGYYILNQAILRLQTGSVGGIVVTLLFVVFFVQGARGAWALHHMEEDELGARVREIGRSDEV